MFNYNGSFTKAIDKQIAQARKAMFAMITKSRRLNLSIEVMIEMFDRTVLPILLYGCEVWGCGNISVIEVFYRSFIRIILKLGKSTPNCMIYGETGKLPLQFNVEKRVLSFWMKISEDKNTKIAVKMYKIALELQGKSILVKHKSLNYNFKWISKVESILHSLGYQNLWEMQKQYDSKLPLYKNICSSVREALLSVWRNKVETGSRCTNYKLFKQTLKLEYYLSNVSPQLRIIMSRFRCGYNRLPVNIFKQKNEIEVDKSCKLCELGVVGDEYHYLFKCPYFKAERILYLNRYIRINPSTQKMQQLFNTKKKTTLRNLAKFQGIIQLKFQN